jgi:hypothetical protein
MLRQIISILLLTTLYAPAALSQQRVPDRFIQVDGFVFDKYLNPVSNVTIYSANLRVGSTSKQNGIYSIISMPGDTIVFSTIGFRRTLLAVPESIADNHYHVDIYLDFDTIAINDVLVLPWGSYAEFKRAVLEADINDTQLENMTDNLILIQNQLINDMGISPGVAYAHMTRQMADAAYIRGQSPANNLLNPFSWAKFFNGLRSGLLRNERK